MCVRVNECVFACVVVCVCECVCGLSGLKAGCAVIKLEGGKRMRKNDNLDMGGCGSVATLHTVSLVSVVAVVAWPIKADNRKW